MPSPILITGTNHLMASFLAASYLVSSDNCVFYLAPRTGALAGEIAELVFRAIRQIAPNQGAERFKAKNKDRLHVGAADFERQDLGLSEEFFPVLGFSQGWYVAGDHHRSDHKTARSHVHMVGNLLRALPNPGLAELNFLGSYHTFCEGSSAEIMNTEAAASKGWGFTKEGIAELCTNHGISFRIFFTSLVVGDSEP